MKNKSQKCNFLILILIIIIIVLWFNNSYSENEYRELFQNDMNTNFVPNDHTPKYPEKKDKIFVQTGHSSGVNSISYSSNGKYIVSGGSDHKVKLWDIESGKLIRTFYGHKKPVESVSFINKDQFVVSGSSDLAAIIWEIRSGKIVETFHNVFSYFSNSVSSSSEELKTLAIKRNNFKAQILRIYSSIPIKLLEEFSDINNGIVITTGIKDPIMKIWDVKSKKQIRTFRGHKDSIKVACFSPDGKKIVSGSIDNTIKLWEVASGKLLRTFEDHKNSVTSIAFSPNGKTIISGSDDYTLKLWEIKSGKLIRTFQGHTYWVKSVCFSPDGRSIASGSSDSTVKIWDAQTGKVVKTFYGYNNSLKTVCFSNNSAYVASGSVDNTVKIWKTKSGKLFKTCQGHSGEINSVCFSPDDRNIISASNDFSIKLWNTESGKFIRTFKGHKGSVNSVAFNPNGKMIASGSSDKTVKLWNVQTGKLMRTLYGHTHFVNCVCFSSDSLTLVSGSWDKTIRLWDTQSGNILKTLTWDSIVSSVSLDPKNKYIVSGSYDSLIMLWDIDSGKYNVLRDHFGPVLSVKFSPDGQHIASGSVDKTVKIWAVDSLKCIKTFSEHTDIVYSVNFSPDGKKIVSGSKDNSLKILYIDHSNTISIALLPENEWISTSLNYHYYNFLSPSCFKYAAIRFDNDSHNWKPLSEELSYKYKIPSVNILSWSPRSVCKENQCIDLVAKFEGTYEKEKKVKIFVNNIEIKKKLGTPPYDIFSKIKLEKYLIDLPKGENVIRIELTVKPFLPSNDQIIIPKPINNPQDNLYFLAIGVDKTKNLDNMNLNYASNDVSDMAHLIKKLEGRLYKKVYTNIFSDKSEKKPISENIVNTFKNLLLIVKPNDTIILFIVAHDVRTNDQYFFLMRESELKKNGSYNLTTVLKWSFLKDILNKLTCKKIIILDTAYTSGVGILSFLGNSLISDQSDHTKNVLLTSTTKSQLSDECDEFQNGCFTHSIKKGLGAFLNDHNTKMPADYNYDNKVTILELVLFLSTELKNITSYQKPEVRIFSNNNFIFYKR